MQPVEMATQPVAIRHLSQSTHPTGLQAPADRAHSAAAGLAGVVLAKPHPQVVKASALELAVAVGAACPMAPRQARLARMVPPGAPALFSSSGAEMTIGRYAMIQGGTDVVVNIIVSDSGFTIEGFEFRAL